MRRGQGIGINIVIIAAIALLVLLVIAMVVTQSGGDLREGINSCVTKGGECLAPGATVPAGMVQSPDGTCAREGDVCYVPS